MFQKACRNKLIIPDKLIIPEVFFKVIFKNTYYEEHFQTAAHVASQNRG